MCDPKSKIYLKCSLSTTPIGNFKSPMCLRESNQGPGHDCAGWPTAGLAPSGSSAKIDPLDFFGLPNWIYRPMFWYMGSTFLLLVLPQNHSLISQNIKPKVAFPPFSDEVKLPKASNWVWWWYIGLRSDRHPIFLLLGTLPLWGVLSVWWSDSNLFLMVGIQPPPERYPDHS